MMSDGVCPPSASSHVQSVCRGEEHQKNSSILSLAAGDMVLPKVTFHVLIVVLLLSLWTVVLCAVQSCTMLAVSNIYMAVCVCVCN